MDRRSPEDDFPRTFPEVELPREFPSKFQSGKDRRSLENPAASAVDDKAAIYRAASAAINERPMERHEPSKAAIYRTATRAEFPSGEAATG